MLHSEKLQKGIGGLGVELRTLGPLDHTNVLLYMTITNTYQTIDIETYPIHDISMCSDFGVKDCS